MIIIVPSTNNDIPALVHLINSAYRGEGSKKGWTTEADLLDGTRTDEANISDLINDLNAVILKCLNEDGEIIACVYLQKQQIRLYLGMLSVSPDIQGAGIGKSLLAAADEHAIKNQCNSVFMTVISVRRELIAWYERHGYKRTDETKPFPIGEKFGIQKQPLELIVLEKNV
jgi:N-acetylglutamate synthase-like GNAT family acetyltransferase